MPLESWLSTCLLGIHRSCTNWLWGKLRGIKPVSATLKTIGVSHKGRLWNPGFAEFFFWVGRGRLTGHQIKVCGYFCKRCRNLEGNDESPIIACIHSVADIHLVSWHIILYCFLIFCAVSSLVNPPTRSGSWQHWETHPWLLYTVHDWASKICLVMPSNQSWQVATIEEQMFVERLTPFTLRKFNIAPEKIPSQ